MQTVDRCVVNQFHYFEDFKINTCMQQQTATLPLPKKESYIMPMFFICALFFIFQAFFVTFSSYMAYFFLALPSSWILKKIGFKNGLVTGLVVLGVGSLLFVPAANTNSFPLFLTGIFIQGSALALLRIRPDWVQFAIAATRT